MPTISRQLLFPLENEAYLALDPRDSRWDSSIAGPPRRLSVKAVGDGLAIRWIASMYR